MNRNQLNNLFALNKGKGSFTIENKATDEATIYLYDFITSDSFFGGISAIDFVKELNSITAKTIHIRISSPGGDVFAARAMAQAIREHPSNIIAHIDGMAASAATFLVIAAEKAVISHGSIFMIHSAWAVSIGSSKDFAEMSALLARTDQSIAADYMAKTGKDQAQIIEFMEAETYFFGQEAVDAGFVDAIAESTVKNKIQWDLSAYAKAPPPKEIVENNNFPDPEPDPEQEDEDEQTSTLLQQNKNRMRLMQSRIKPTATHKSKAA